MELHVPAALSFGKGIMECIVEEAGLVTVEGMCPSRDQNTGPSARCPSISAFQYFHWLNGVQ
jgi:hypothetical protein